MEKIPFHNKNPRGSYNSDPRLQILSHLSVVEQAVHLWNNVMVFKYSLENIEYIRPRKIHTVNPGNWKIFLPLHSKKPYSTEHSPTEAKIKTMDDGYYR